MSQTRRGSLLQNLYGVVRQELIQGLHVSPAALEQSLLLRLYVFLSTSFATYICIITNAITHDQQSQTEMYMLMNATCVFTAVQLGLMCWLVFAIAPGVQLLFELVAWVCCHSGTAFCSLIGAVFSGSLVEIVTGVARCCHSWRTCKQRLSFYRAQLCQSEAEVGVCWRSGHSSVPVSASDVMSHNGNQLALQCRWSDSGYSSATCGHLYWCRRYTASCISYLLQSQSSY